MAADVSTGQSEDDNKKELVTRDLLGSGSGDEKETWEKKFDLLRRTSPERDEIHDLNLPPPPPPPPPTTTASFSNICTLEKVKTALERAMRESVQSSTKPAPNRDPKPVPKSEESDGSPSSSTKRKSEAEETDGRDEAGAMGCGSMMVTVCPGCYQYLLVPKVDPRCPSVTRTCRSLNVSKQEFGFCGVCG